VGTSEWFFCHGILECNEEVRGIFFYFVISSGTQWSREIFAAGNGRNVVKSAQPSFVSVADTFPLYYGGRQGKRSERLRKSD
jgi:hypothetical protein